MTPVKLVHTANSDLKKAVAYYSKVEPSLGLDFAEDVERALAYLRSDPKAFPKVRNEVRHTTLSRFPYNLFFTIGENEVLVLAISHFRKRPGYRAGRQKK